MVAATLGALLLGSSVALHLDEIGELPLDEASLVADALGRAITVRSGAPFVLDDPLWPSCTEADRCLSAVRDRTRAEVVVFLKLYAAPTRIRLIAERVNKTEAGARAEASVPRPVLATAPLFAELAGRLFPQPLAVQPASLDLATRTESPPPAPPSRLPGLLTLGGSALALGVGVALGLSSRSARDEIETVSLSDADYEDRLERMRLHGWSANVLFGVALAGGVAGTWLLLAD